MWRMLKKNKRTLEWAVAFWIGVGLMSIINVWKITYTRGAILYSWIMFCVSVIFVVISLILIKKKNDS
jgi:hypothetical protein